MIKTVLVKFYSWDRPLQFRGGDFELKRDDWVLAKTELGPELGRVVGYKNVDGGKLVSPLEPILAKATAEDLKRFQELNSERESTLAKCQTLIKKHQLVMKLVDCYFSFDGSKIIFAFTAEGRIDFRELLKDLTKAFRQSIRLQQIGTRDEAKMMGGVGPCGRMLCCQGFLRELGNVTSESAKLQQVAHRGSERLSGVCGRLKCCLNYEKELYEKMSKNFPAVGSELKTKQGKGIVVGWNILKRSVNIEIDNKTIIEVPIKRQ